jgi:hypothetical protein
MQQRDYVRRLLEAYRATPGTCGAVRRPDRLLAAQLHQRGVPIETVENALVLAASRRLTRPADWRHSLAGVLLTGHRRGPPSGCESGVLPVSAPRHRADHGRPIVRFWPIQYPLATGLHACGVDEVAPPSKPPDRACGADDDASPPRSQSCSQ